MSGPAARGGHAVRRADDVRRNRASSHASTAGPRREHLAGMRPRRPPHPLEHHASFRAVIAAAPPLAELATRLRTKDRAPEPADLIGTLAIACGDLADGFAAPPDSRRRITAHQRAWIAVREIDRAVTAAARRRLAPPE